MNFSHRKLFSVIALLAFSSYSANAQCWSKVASGWYHNVGIQTDGTLWSWGKNDVGQLGDGSFINRNLPVQVGSANNWAFVAAADSHSIAIKTDGTLWAWGLNDSGQLGDGTQINKNFPVQVGSDTDWQSVSLGTKFSTAIKTDGSLWTWGESGSNQLGNGSSAFDENQPVPIGNAINWSIISAGQSSTLALRLDGTLWGWGSHANGALGNGLITETTQFPTQSGTDSDWSVLKTGSSTSLALKSDNSLWSWGGNTFGALGTNAPANDPAEFPVLVNDNAMWNYIAMGRFHSYAIKSDGTLWIWGRNQSGQIGDNSTVNKFTPVQIGAATNWLAAVGGDQHSIAISENHTLYSWGSNTFGQLGDGTNINKLTPTALGMPCALDVSEQATTTIKIYPNPFDDACTIELNLPDGSDIAISIYNSLGQHVTEFKSALVNKTLVIPSTEFSTGLYLITITHNGNTLSATAVKK